MLTKSSATPSKPTKPSGPFAERLIVDSFREQLVQMLGGLHAASLEYNSATTLTCLIVSDPLALRTESEDSSRVNSTLV